MLTTSAGLILHVVHISGKCMIAQGTDGLSRGDHTEGVMQGRGMGTYMLLHLSALQRSPSLQLWMSQAFGPVEPVFLEPEDWFTMGQGYREFVCWAPPPAAADVMTKQLGKAPRLKRPESLHVIIVPRLMTGYWRRGLLRE